MIGRDGQELSATGTRLRNLAHTDHLAILHAIWQGEVTKTREKLYRDLLEAALPAGCRGEASHMAGGCGAPCAPPNSPPHARADGWQRPSRLTCPDTEEVRSLVPFRLQ